MAGVLKNRLGVTLGLAAQGIGIFTLLRLVLLAYSWSAIPHDPASVASAFWIGLRMDVAVTGCLLTPVVLALLLTRPRTYLRWRQTAVTKISYGVFFYWFVFLNVCEYYFFDEFNSRFNYIAVDYVFTNTQEVLSIIWESYPLLRVATLVGFGVWMLYRAVRGIFGHWLSEPFSRRQRAALAGAWLLVTGAALASVRLDLLTASPNRILGEISANGFYTLAYALGTNNLVYSQFYPTMGAEEALDHLRQRLNRPGVQWLHDPRNPLRRTIDGHPGLGRANVVILLEESLGSEFMDALRPRPDKLTPNLDKLAGDGLLFTHFYATGNRTVRALEAVLASFPPIPGSSIVKRRPSQPVQTIAGVLKSQGYNTLFIYGGRGIFDDLRPFALHNGYDRLVEQKDFADPVFQTTWGVSDEDIFSRAIAEMDALAAQGKPFFTTILSVSNHKPYTYPPGRIDLKPEEKRREHAVKYADWAIGHFFDLARVRPFFANTVFAILGDHGARVYGADFIPIASYEIPLVIYAPGPGLKPGRIERIGDSMDVAPTLLGLLGVRYESIFFGKDLLGPDEGAGYALVQHDREVGLLDGNRLALLSTPRLTAVFDFDATAERFAPREQPDATDRKLLQDAIAFYQTGYDLYTSGRYILPGPASP